MKLNTTSNILKVTAPAEMKREALPAWQKQVLAELEPAHTSLEVDMSKTTFMDSNGLATLLFLNQEMVKRSCQMRLINPARQVIQLLEITRMHRTINIVQRDETDAADSAKPRPILIVEDDQHIRMVAELSMRPLGRPVLLAENGEEAIAIARRENPAIIILDHIMPVMDGLATLRGLKSDDATRHIPVIMMSASGKLAYGMSEQFADASIFVAKPFSPSSLRQEVHRILQENLELVA